MRLSFAVAAVALLGFAQAEDITTPPQPAPPQAMPGAGKSDAAKFVALTPPPATFPRTPMAPRSTLTPAGMLARLLSSLGLDSPKSVRWDMLPFGMDKRFLTDLQAGSVENPGAVDFPGQAGWPIEEVLKVSAEEAQALQAVREEYEAKRKKLDQEVLEFDKAETEKLRKLRLHYEQKANEALSPDLREAKRKFDALREEFIAKKKAMAAEVLGPDRGADGSRVMAEANKLPEALSKVLSEIEPKFLELLPAEAKAKIEPLIKQQAANRARMIKQFAPPANP